LFFRIQIDMTRSRALQQAVLLALLLAGSAGAFAQAPPQSPPPERERRGQREQLPESVRRVERETGGEVLRAEPMQRDGHEVYRFKVLTADGRVRVMQDDPNARRGDARNDRNDDDGARSTGNRGAGKGKGKEKRPSRDPDGEPQQF
jgi:hypothetical protein